MRDRPVIYGGLLLFLILFTFPLWRDRMSGASTKGPQPAVPGQARQCVAPVAYMKTSHMVLLLDWREQVVRSDRREFQSLDGKKYNRSLTSTCLEQCHGTKTEFCDRCHNYAAVSVPCWDCHLDAPRGLVAQRIAR